MFAQPDAGTHRRVQSLAVPMLAPCNRHPEGYFFLLLPIALASRALP
jgi:hypothetical protein